MTMKTTFINSLLVTVLNLQTDKMSFGKVRYFMYFLFPMEAYDGLLHCNVANEYIMNTILTYV